MLEFLRGFKAFLDYKYWLNPRPVPLGPSLVGGIFAFFGWFLIIGLGLYLLARWLKKSRPLEAGVLRRFARLLFNTGLLGLLFLLFTYEQLPFLGMRLWFLLVFILFLYWLVRAIIYFVRDYPKFKSKENERQRLEKYLPNAKKK